MAIAALMLVFVPAEAKASVTTEEPIAVKKDVQIKEGEQLISQKTYEDEDGNEVTEKVYVTFDKQAAKSAMSRSSISGTIKYKKERMFSIKTGKAKRGTIRCYVIGNFKMENGRVWATNATGKVTQQPGGVTITNKRATYSGNHACFKFDARSKYETKRSCSVTITVLNNGSVY